VRLPEPIGRLTAATERLVLRPLQEDDRLEFERVLRVSRDAWGPWTPAHDPSLSDAEIFRREILRATHGARAGTHLRLAAFTADGALAGLFALNEIVRGVFQSAYASWQVAADLVGRGYGTEGVSGLLALAFRDAPTGLGLHRVQANVMPANAASLRIAEKAGFRREGLARAYLKIAGAWEDHVMLATTREEWVAGKSDEGIETAPTL
jgi:ribosomal-protein-alanine N-acetyltransferase